MKKIIVSAVNFTEGGPLSILKDCLEFLSLSLSGEYEVIALVNDERLFSYKNIRYISFPNSKKSWANRLYYEYFYFNKLAKQLDPFLWISLHDITPNVKAERLAVYCHNPAPFYKMSFREIWLDPKFMVFNLFYKYLYSINIQKNNFVIVQQEWLRREFVKLFNVKNVIVAHPGAGERRIAKNDREESKGNDRCVFFYPAFPRVFKNFEIICEALKLLLKEGEGKFEVILTLSGHENRYARYISQLSKDIEQIKFVGAQEKHQVYEFYRMADCVIFPSKIETWGLPITEAKLFGKDLLLADFEYAHETLGAYDKVLFFDAHDPATLAEAMKSVIYKTVSFQRTADPLIPDPFTQSWKDLFNILLTK